MVAMRTEPQAFEAERARFGRQIRDAREKRWPTRPQFRKATGIPEPTMVKVERGDPVRLETLIRVADALGLDVPEQLASGLARTHAPGHEEATPGDGPPAWFTQAHEQQMAALKDIQTQLATIRRKLR